MPDLTLTINVPEFTPEELERAIIHEAASQVLGIVPTRGFDEDGMPYGSRGLFDELRCKTTQAVEKQVKMVVEREVPAVVQEVLNAEFQPMDRFGDMSGKPTTLRAMIGTYAESWLTTKVGKQSGKKNAYHPEAKVPRLHHLIAKEVEEVYTQDLRSVAKEAAAEIKKQIAAKVACEITDTVQRVLGIHDGSRR